MSFATFIEAMASSFGLEFASEVSRLMAKAVSVAFAMGIAHGKSYDSTTVAERARVQQTLQELTGAAVGDLFALAGAAGRHEVSERGPDRERRSCIGCGELSALP